MDKLQETLELIEKRDAHLARLVAKEVDDARSYSANNKKSEALLCMKRKRVHEKEREQLATQKLNLMQTEATLHALRFNSVVMETQERAGLAIEREVKRVGGAEGVERVQDRLEDALADSRDVLAAASTPMGEAATFDEAELLDELDQLEQDMDELELTEALTATDTAGAHGQSAHPLFASVPRDAPAPTPAARRAAVAARAEEERELAELATLRRQMEQPMPMMPAPMMAAPMMAVCH